MYQENELKHYGVLGMKWGIRRYQKKNGGLTSAGKKRYTSWSTKRLKKKYAKTGNRAYKREAEKQQRFDDRYSDYAEKTSVGKAIAGNLLLGAFQYKTYSMARSSGMSRGEAAVRSILDLGQAATPLPILFPQGVSLQRAYIRRHSK